MRALVYRRYGGPEVLAVEDVPAPVATERQVLVQVRAVSLNRSDWEALTGRPAYVRLGGTGVRRPKQAILGSDIAGVVTAVGGDVAGFAPGDEILADTIYFGHGGLAAQVAISVRAPLAHKPAGLSFEAGAAVPQAAVLALQALQRPRPVAAGERVAIVGAGGGAGSFAVQIARSMGAEVTGVDHGRKAGLMRSLGAAHVVDYTREDYTRGGWSYDRIVDFVAARSLRANRRALTGDGVYHVAGGSVPRLLSAAVAGGLRSRFGNRHMGVLVGKPNSEDLAEVAERAATGTLTPAIDRTYRLEEAAEALRRLGAGEALGKQVVVP